MSLANRRAGVTWGLTAMHLRSKSGAPRPTVALRIVGLEPARAAHSRGSSPTGAFRASGGRRLARETIARMASLVDAGLTTAEAVRIGAECGGSPGPALARAAAALARGLPPSRALAAAGIALGHAELGLIAAGERSGATGPALAMLSARLEREAREHCALAAALSYPCLLLLASTVVLLALSMLVLPSIAELYEDLDGTLPPLTAFLLAVGAAVRSYGGACALAIVTVVSVAFCLLHLVPTMRLAAWRGAARVPWLGTVLECGRKAPLYGLLAALLRAGCEFAEALGLAAETIEDPWLARRFARLRRLVARGVSPSDALARSGVDRAGHEASMLRVAEAGGDYPAAFERLSAIAGQRRDELLARFTRALEPAAICALAALVGAGVLAVYQPILGAAGLLGGAAP